MATVTPKYTVNYNDQRFAQVEGAKQAALSGVEQIYGGMINATDRHYNDLINESKAWAEEQKKQQQAQTDFAIDKIEQQREQAQKDYTREQSGAYVDWQKQSNQYGVNAEQMAAAGMQNSGFSESSQVSMYTTYQNRVATARESFALANLNYDNNIKDAMLQNSAALAQIAHDSYKQQLELALEGFQYKNDLVIQKANKRLEIENTYYNRYQDVLAQINEENRRAEEARQFEANYALKMQEYNEGVRQFNEDLARLKEQDALDSARAAAELEHKKEQDAFDNAHATAELEFKKKQLEEEKRQFDANMAAKESSSDGSSGGSGGGGSGKIITGSSGDGSVNGNTPNNPKIDKNSWAAVEKKFGGKISESEMAAYVANGMVDMRIGADGTAYFTVPVRLAKSGAMVDMKD